MRHKYDYVFKVGVTLFFIWQRSLIFFIVIILSHNIYYGTFKWKGHILMTTAVAVWGAASTLIWIFSSLKKMTSIWDLWWVLFS